MTAVVPRSLAAPHISANRRLVALAGFALAASIVLLFHRVAPEAPALGLGLAGLAGLAELALAVTLDDAALLKLMQASVVAVALIMLGAVVEQDTRVRLFSFASAAFGVALAVWLARTARRRPSVSLPLAALFAATLALLSAYAAYLVLASRDLMIADFMTYRGIAVMVAKLADAGNWPLLLGAVTQSITQDYSWAPALLPGLVLAVTEPTARAIYTFGLLALYAAPAALALAILARDLAIRAGPHRPGAFLGLRPELATGEGRRLGTKLQSPACWRLSRVEGVSAPAPLVGAGGVGGRADRGDSRMRHRFLVA